MASTLDAVDERADQIQIYIHYVNENLELRTYQLLLPVEEKCPAVNFLPHTLRGLHQIWIFGQNLLGENFLHLTKTKTSLLPYEPTPQLRTNPPH